MQLLMRAMKTLLSTRCHHHLKYSENLSFDNFTNVWKGAIDGEDPPPLIDVPSPLIESVRVIDSTFRSSIYAKGSGLGLGHFLLLLMCHMTWYFYGHLKHSAPVLFKFIWEPLNLAYGEKPPSVHRTVRIWLHRHCLYHHVSLNMEILCDVSSFESMSGLKS